MTQSIAPSSGRMPAVGSLALCLSVLCWSAAAAVQTSEPPTSRYEERMNRFQAAVCEKCGRRGIACGCELGHANPPFALLRAYARASARWQRRARKESESGGSQTGSNQWVLVDVEGGAGNQLIHMTGALTVAIILQRPLVLKHNTILTYPFDPVVEFDDEDSLVNILFLMCSS